MLWISRIFEAGRQKRANPAWSTMETLGKASFVTVQAKKGFSCNFSR